MPSIPDASNRTIGELVSLAGRHAVVTGGARGLGFGIARRLAEAGADVLIGDLTQELATQAAADLQRSNRSQLLGTYMDVTKTPTIVTAADLAVERLGGIDIWVNNAGIFPSVEIPNMTDEIWDQVLAVNGRGVFVSSREAAKRMGDKGGVIVNIASTAGFGGVAPGLAAYVASKHAVRGITRQMALELAPRAIRVLGVAPTYCETEGNKAQIAANSDRDKLAQNIPAVVSSRLGRVGVPDDIARAVLFCASDMSIFMTGSTLLVDAGETL